MKNKKIKTLYEYEGTDKQAMAEMLSDLATAVNDLTERVEKLEGKTDTSMGEFALCNCKEKMKLHIHTPLGIMEIG